MALEYELKNTDFADGVYTLKWFNLNDTDEENNEEE